QTAKRLFWPSVPDELRKELLAMARGLAERGKHVDEWDLLAENGYFEIVGSYIPSLTRPRPRSGVPIAGSAFIATGSFTKEGRIVMAGSAWTPYWLGERESALLDIAPRAGHRFVMNTLPGLIHSADAFYMTDAGLMLTATPIAQFHGFDPLGAPEFV